MATYVNVINYAQEWKRELIDFIMQDTISAEHITSNVNWLTAETFNFTILSTSGYQDHVRTGGWNAGKITQTNVPYTVSHDRDIEFLVDKADVDESNLTASAKNVTNVFMIENQNPETDAYFFSTVASTSGAVTTTETDTAVGTILARLKRDILPIRKYGARNIRGYLSSAEMDLLEQSSDFTRNIEIDKVMSGEGDKLETRVTYLDGVKLIEVYDADRFYTAFTYDDAAGGFQATVGGKVINHLFCTLSHTVTVPKIASIYFFAPGGHTKGDGFLYQNRSYWDTFSFPNAKTATVDSITVSVGAAVPSV